MDALPIYMKDVRRVHRRIPRAQQVALHQRAKRGDRDAEAELIASVLPYAYRIAKAFDGKGIDLTDLIQLANIGLIKAVRKWEPARGALTTYATDWCMRDIRDAITMDATIIHTPKYQIYRAKQGKAAPTVEPLAQHDPLDSLPEPIDVAAEREDRERLAAALALLTPRELQVLRLRLNRESMPDIGQKLGISKQRVGQLEAAAVRKLRKALTGAKDGTAGKAVAV